jgi:hypothetical protein
VRPTGIARQRIPWQGKRTGGSFGLACRRRTSCAGSRAIGRVRIPGSSGGRGREEPGDSLLASRNDQSVRTLEGVQASHNRHDRFDPPRP